MLLEFCETRSRETRGGWVLILFPTHPTYQNPININPGPLLCKVSWFFGFSVFAQFFIFLPYWTFSWPGLARVELGRQNKGTGHLLVNLGFWNFRFSDFRFSRILFWKTFSKNMLVRYRGINNKGVLERPWTKWGVLRAISSTLKFQFTIKCWKLDFLTSSKTRSCQSSREKLRMVRALLLDTPRPPQFQPELPKRKCLWKTRFFQVH